MVAMDSPSNFTRGTPWGGKGGVPPFPIFPRPQHWYPYSYRQVSLWFLVELVEIYQMTYRYMGVISLPYTLKLLVDTFDGHSRWQGGGTPPPYPQGVPLVKFDGESIATIKNFS